MNDITQRNPSQLTSLTSLAAEAGGSNTGDPLLRLLREGIWVMGAGNDEVDEDSVWAINPYSFAHGYIAWADSQVEGEVMVPAGQPLPSRAELPQVSDGWDDQLAFSLRCIKGPDKGVQVLYKTTSVGGKRAVGNMATEVARQASEGADVVPVVRLDVDSYQHKKYGRIYTPVFNIEGWRAMDADVEGTDESEQAEAEVEQEKPSPRRRRRQR